MLGFKFFLFSRLLIPAFVPKYYGRRFLEAAAAQRAAQRRQYDPHELRHVLNSVVHQQLRSCRGYYTGKETHHHYRTLEFLKQGAFFITRLRSMSASQL